MQKDVQALRDAVSDLRRAANTAQHLTSRGQRIPRLRLTADAKQVQEMAGRFATSRGKRVLSTEALYRVLDAMLEVVILAACDKADRLMRCGRARQSLTRALSELQ
jgi:hypothetical protein